MLKLPKGLKKKKKGKKSKRKDQELFTEEELEKYKKEHQQHQEQPSSTQGHQGQANENEEWSKFKDLTTGIDSVLKKTQGDLDRIKSTSFFQRVPAGPRQVDSVGKELPQRPAPSPPVAHYSEADFAVVDDDKSDCAVTDSESEEDVQDDIFDTSYVEAVERGEVKLALVPDSPEDFHDDGLFDTSHVDALIKGQDSKLSRGKKALDIGVAVEVLTGRIDNVTITSKKSKRAIPGDLLLESGGEFATSAPALAIPAEQSILDSDADLPITSPIDLSVSLHTSLIQQQRETEKQELDQSETFAKQEADEFTLLATESLGGTVGPQRLEEEVVDVKPVIEESWSVFEADTKESVFAEGIIEDQLDADPYLVGSDPFDTSFADAVVPNLKRHSVNYEEDDDDFDPRADEVKVKLNNRRKSSVRIHLTDPTGLRESITSDDINDRESQTARDLLGGSTTDLTQLGDTPLDPVDITDSNIDPFDTTLVDKIVAPGKVELKFLEQELIGSTQIYRVESDPDFDPRADEEATKDERRASRPENLTVSKSVIFNVTSADEDAETRQKSGKPLTPYYTRELSISEDAEELAEQLTRTKSDEHLAEKTIHTTKRRHSEFTSHAHHKFKQQDIFEREQDNIKTKVLTPTAPQTISEEFETDPFDTSFATNIVPSKTELKLLAKEFSCEETIQSEALLDPSDDIFQVKALTPEPTAVSVIRDDDDIDPFDTSFATNLQPGKTELKLLESELLN